MQAKENFNPNEQFKLIQPYLMMASNSIIDGEGTYKDKQILFGLVIGHFLGSCAHMMGQQPGMEEMDFAELVTLQLDLIESGIIQEVARAKESTEQS